MVNLVVDDVKKIVEAFQGTLDLPVFSFSPLEQFDLHLENTYPLVLAYAKTATAQIDSNLKSYDLFIICLEKMPIREVGESDYVYQKRVLDKQELFKEFIQHVVYFLTSGKYNFLYTLTGDLIRFTDTQEYLEWDLNATEAVLNVVANTDMFVCGLPFDEEILNS